MFCKNCGALTSSKKVCGCSAVLAPQIAQPEEFPVIYHDDTEKDTSYLDVVSTDSRQINFRNSGNFIHKPIKKPPFDLQGFSNQEISHWIKKVIDWHYESRKDYRLAYGGLIGYAELCLGNIYASPGKERIKSVKEIAKQFIAKTFVYDVTIEGDY